MGGNIRQKLSKIPLATVLDWCQVHSKCIVLVSSFSGALLTAKVNFHYVFD